MTALDKARAVLADPLHVHLANHLARALRGLVAECSPPPPCGLPSPDGVHHCWQAPEHDGDCWAPLDGEALPAGHRWQKKATTPLDTAK